MDAGRGWDPEVESVAVCEIVVGGGLAVGVDGLR
jgi:hypothetical protein